MTKCYPIYFLFSFFLSTQLSAVTKTWVGPDGGSWSTGANWSPAGAPAVGDQVLVTGFVGAIIMPSATVPIQSLLVINGSDVVFTGTNNNSRLSINCTGCDSEVENGSTATFTGEFGFSNKACSLIFNGSPNLTVNGSLVFTGAGTSSLIASTANLTINGSLLFSGSGNSGLICTGGTTTVNGELRHTGGGNTSGATTSNLFVQDNATYEIAKNGGMVPNANWAFNSNLRISGMTTTAPTFINGATLGNFWWECIGQSEPAEFNVDLTMNRMDIYGTGASEIRLATVSGNGQMRTWTILGEYTQNGGIVNLSSGSNGIGKISFKGSNFYALMTLTESSSGGKGIVEFCGAQPQVAYFGHLNNTIDVVINTADRVLLNTSMTINSGAQLVLSNGKVVSTADYPVVIAAGATVVGGSVSSHVLGPMRKIGNTAFVFPIGKATTYAPLAITAPSAPTDTFTAEYFHSAYSNTTNVSSPLVRVSTLEYWQLARSSGSGPVQVTLNWESGPASGINHLPSLAVARFNGSSWVSLDGTASGTTTKGSIQSDTTSAFSWFTFGSKSADFNPLPVQLTYFTAKARRNDVLLNWITASEKNNAFFAIERSAEGQVFETVGQLTGAGTTQQEQRYEFVDATPLKGTNFYRLRQVDYDGLVAYSPSRSVNWVGTGSGQGQLLLFPSPVQDVLQVQLEEGALPEMMLHWEILNISGQQVLTGQWVGRSGRWEAPVGQLPKGTYLLRCSAGPISWSKTFVKSGY